ncbi:MAG: glycine cleavage system protein GcvH [Trueperaceae bacterium]|nr:glycine cleavage system protein GcvH [Trueperaceae bacterium]
MDTPDTLRYTRSHEWATDPADGVVTVGITDFAQDQLGDVVFVELPKVGTKVKAGQAIAVIESVKTASDIYAPLDGEIVAVNEVLNGEPEAINAGPYEGGWLFRIEPTDPSAWNGLLEASAYEAVAQEG